MYCREVVFILRWSQTKVSLYVFTHATVALFHVIGSSQDLSDMDSVPVVMARFLQDPDVRTRMEIQKMEGIRIKVNPG